MGTETEVKLAADPSAIAAILADPAFFGEGAAAKEQVSTYFDTAEHALQAAGLSLRIRRIGERRIQTVKAERDGATSLFARAEWEEDVPGDEPVLDASAAAVSGLLGDAPALLPLFTCDVTRTAIIREARGSRIELVADHGRIEAREGVTAAISELELELVEGAPAALFAEAKLLAARIPLRLGVQSKSERGYALLAAETAGAIKAEPVKLDRDGDAAALFTAVANACIRHYRLNEDRLILTGAPQPLHQARVAIRRLRSALTIFRAMLRGPEFDHMRGELRWLAGLLGQVRDLDVLAQRVDDAATLALIADARERALADALEAIDGPRVRLLMLDCAGWVAVGAWRDEPARAELRATPARLFAHDVLDQLRGKLKKGGRGLAELDDEARHEARIIAKKLRYAAEFFAALYPGGKATRRRTRFLDQIGTLQSSLGDLNDIAHGSAVLAGLGVTDPAALLGTTKPKATKRLLADAEAAYEGLIDEKRFWR